MTGALDAWEGEGGAYDHAEPFRQALDSHTVAVPDTGEWYVRDGKVIQIVETDLTDSNSEYWTYKMWIDAPAEDD